MGLTIEQALQQGVAAHKVGKLQDAERLYRVILQSQPLHPGANHNLGLIAVSVNKADVALLHFKVALEANPMIEQYWVSYIDALVKVNKLKDAKQVIKKAKKKGFDTKKLRALLTQSRGRVDTKMPSEEKLSSLLACYQNGRLGDAEKLAVSITQEFPKHQVGWKVLGAIFGQTGRNIEAVNANQTAVALCPHDAEAHSNLGITLKDLGRLDEAEVSLRQATALKPDSVEALSNLGITLQELGRLDEAEASYKQSIELKPDYAKAHCNLGVTLQLLGRLDEAEASYTQAIVLKPDFAEARHNLVELLTIHAPQKQASQQIVKVDREIKEIDLKDRMSGVISDDKIVRLLCKSSIIIKKHNLEIGTHLSQAYRRNSVDLNCRRHKLIFNKFSVIPKFCFGCYKVQVEPRSLLELIKLFVVFDQIKLVENNTRKCMIEMRPEIPGFYKGLIYCSSLEEACQIADYLETVVKESIGPGLSVAVKRGCSEYPISFPDYKEINKSGAQLMNYNDDWKLIEEDYDAKNPLKYSNIIMPSLSCLSLLDILIIQNWIDYAKAVGDPSVELLSQSPVFSQRIYSIAKTRLETHPWQDLA